MPKSTCYAYVQEGIKVLARRALPLVMTGGEFASTVVKSASGAMSRRASCCSGSRPL